MKFVRFLHRIIITLVCSIFEVSVYFNLENDFSEKLSQCWESHRIKSYTVIVYHLTSGMHIP